MGLSRVGVERDCRFQMLPGFVEMFEVNESKRSLVLGRKGRQFPVSNLVTELCRSTGFLPFRPASLEPQF